MLAPAALVAAVLICFVSSAVVGDLYETAIARVANDPALLNSFPKGSAHVDESKWQLLDDLCSAAWVALRYPNSKKEGVVVSVEEPTRLPMAADPQTLAVVVSMTIEAQKHSLTFFYSGGTLRTVLMDRSTTVKFQQHAIPKQDSAEYILLKKTMLKILGHKKSPHLHNHLESVKPSLGDRVFGAMGLAMVRRALGDVTVQLVGTKCSRAGHGVKIDCKTSEWSAVIAIDGRFLMVHPFEDATTSSPVAVAF